MSTVDVVDWIEGLAVVETELVVAGASAERTAQQSRSQLQQAREVLQSLGFSKRAARPAARQAVAELEIRASSVVAPARAVPLPYESHFGHN
jgi:Holliday junction resolvasome RuvABC DNA-binding subunit